MYINCTYCPNKAHSGYVSADGNDDWYCQDHYPYPPLKPLLVSEPGFIYRPRDEIQCSAIGVQGSLDGVTLNQIEIWRKQIKGIDEEEKRKSAHIQH